MRKRADVLFEVRVDCPAVNLEASALKSTFITFVAMTALSFTAIADPLTPPVAKKVPKTVTLHGDERVDDYGWLRDKKSADTIAYLEAENAYADAMTKPNEEL